MPFNLEDTTYSSPERLVVAIWGKEKVGKSSFALTAPGPIWLLNLDWGYKPVLSVAEGKEVNVASYVLPDQFSVAAYKTIINQFMKDWADAVSSAATHHGTVIIDTASQLWQVIGEGLTGEIREDRAETNEQKLADGGRAAKDSRLDWRRANSAMDAILKRPLTIAGNNKANAIYIQRASEIYEGSQATGRVKMHGFSTTGSIVEMVLCQEVEDPKKVGDTARYVARVDFSRYLGQTLRGVKIENPTWQKIMDLVS